MNVEFNPDRLEKMAEEYLAATRSLHDANLRDAEQLVMSINVLRRENYRLMTENERLRSIMCPVN